MVFLKININKEKVKKLFSKATYSLCTVSVLGAISYFIYDIYLSLKLNNVDIYFLNRYDIEKHYEDHDINIFIFNDSQGINLNAGFWKDSYPEYLAKSLDANVVDCSSLKYNKTSHVNYVLKNNLSIEEFKRVNNEATNAAISKVVSDLGINSQILQNAVGKIGEMAFKQKINNGDNNKHISDMLKESYHPIVIYSSGANDLMYLLNCNPMSLKKYDDNLNETDQYKYAMSVIEDSNTIDSVINGIDENIKNILAINPDAHIYVLSIYKPKSLRKNEYHEIAEFIDKYNEALKELCGKRNIRYIDEDELGNAYNENSKNFHINEVGHKVLASALIDEISDSLDSEDVNHYFNFKYENNGLDGLYKDLVDEVSTITPYSLDNYSYIVLSRKIEEKEKDAKIVEKFVKEKTYQSK